MALKLEVGKKYKDGHGYHVFIKKINKYSLFTGVYPDGTVSEYEENGRCCFTRDRKQDLIEEVK